MAGPAALGSVLEDTIVHLVGLQVAEIERGVWFYCEALAAEVMMRPTLMEGRTAERAMQGPPGTRFDVSVIRIGDGAVQLFSLGVGQRPEWSRGGHAGGIPQLGVQVDDVTAAIRRFEPPAGGGCGIGPASGAARTWQTSPTPTATWSSSTTRHSRPSWNRASRCSRRRSRRPDGVQRRWALPGSGTRRATTPS